MAIQPSKNGYPAIKQFPFSSSHFPTPLFSPFFFPSIQLEEFHACLEAFGCPASNQLPSSPSHPPGSPSTPSPRARLSGSWANSASFQVSQRCNLGACSHGIHFVSRGGLHSRKSSSGTPYILWRGSTYLPRTPSSICHQCSSGRHPPGPPFPPPCCCAPKAGYPPLHLHCSPPLPPPSPSPSAAAPTYLCDQLW